MPQIINLNRARKAKEQLESRADSNKNAVKFGLTKAEKALNAAKAEKSRRDLDGAKRE